MSRYTRDNKTGRYHYNTYNGYYETGYYGGGNNFGFTRDIDEPEGVLCIIQTNKDLEELYDLSYQPTTISIELHVRASQAKNHINLAVSRDDIDVVKIGRNMASRKQFKTPEYWKPFIKKMFKLYDKDSEYKVKTALFHMRCYLK